MTSGIYVYYCISPEKEKAAREAVQQILDAVAAATQLQGKLLCRMEDATTWMEVYEPVSDANALLTVLEEAVANSGLSDYLLPGTRRHLEHFVPLNAR